MIINHGVTDVTRLVFIADPAATDGGGLTGLSAAAVDVAYVRNETDNDVVVTDVTSSMNDITLTAAHTDWGWEEVSSTLAPGLYRIDIADAVFATGATQAVVYVMVDSGDASPAILNFDLGPPDVNVTKVEGSAPDTAATIAAAILAATTTDGGTVNAIISELAALLIRDGATLTGTTRSFKNLAGTIVMEAVFTDSGATRTIDHSP